MRELSFTDEVRFVRVPPIPSVAKGCSCLSANNFRTFVRPRIRGQMETTVLEVVFWGWTDESDLHDPLVGNRESSPLPS